ncbi:unnamed protein product [Merluccius merluccius]
MEWYPALASILLFVAVQSCDGGKVLVFPVDGSHWLNMKLLIEALHTRGHQITVLRSSTSWYVSQLSPHYTSITIPLEQPQNLEDQAFMASFLNRSIEIRRHEGTVWAFLAFYSNLFSMLEQSQKTVSLMLTTMFENRTLMQEVKESQYNVVLADPCFPAGPILAHYLKLPLVFNVRWLPTGEAHFAIAPSPLSYVPQLFSLNTDKMDLSQRLKNVFYHGLLFYMFHFVTSPPYQAFCDRYFSNGVNVLSLIQEADIWLMRMDFTFEFPRPTMPNVVYIGGFNCRPSKPLPSDLEAFVHSSGDHGVVVMSLGTLFGNLGPEISEVIAAAFARLPQKVVWRYLGQQPSNLGNNTLLVKWLPQNDMLGHPKTRAFITHGGTNGIYEAIYHGVPVLGIPLVFDQFDNMVRLKSLGVAEVVEVTTLEVESLTRALQNVLDPEKPYRDNMHRLSQLHHDKPLKPMDSATFWVEFVMRHKGAAHLRTESYKLPWYVYHSIDVIMLLVISGLFMVALFCALCTCLMRALARRGKAKHE